MFDMLGNYEQRKVNLYRKDSLFISTVKVTDGDKIYETAIAHPEYNKGTLIIVDKYDTIEEAKRGHEKWVITMTSDNLPEKLVDCQNSWISKLAGPEEFKRSIT